MKRKTDDKQELIRLKAACKKVTWAGWAMWIVAGFMLALAMAFYFFGWKNPPVWLAVLLALVIFFLSMQDSSITAGRRFNYEVARETKAERTLGAAVERLQGRVRQLEITAKEDRERIARSEYEIQRLMRAMDMRWE